MDRREFLKTGLAATAAFTTFGASFWRQALARHPEPVPGTSPYGPLRPADLNGLRLPDGFSSRVIARSLQPVEGTAYLWHPLPDGGATYATPDGGWIYACNSEVPAGGGAGAVRFDASGKIVDAYRILGGTSTNCAGGPTPWGTWLSCEEIDAGHVWECDPTGQAAPQLRLALGTFKHEAACVDPVRGHVYLTEDTGASNFYRFTPDTPGDLSSGKLEAAIVHAPFAWMGGPVEWGRVTNPNIVPGATPTRSQVAGAARFDRGEGMFYDAVAEIVYFCTTGDDRIWAYDVATETIEVLFDGRNTPKSPLSGADNIVVSSSGDIFVCEDGGNMEIVMISHEGIVGPILQSLDSGSEITGAAFSPDGSRLYFSSQRGNRVGITLEVTGPFRTERPTA